MRLNILDWIIILGYCVVSAAVGLWFSRRSKNREDFFVAGRKLNWFVAGTSIVATYLAVDTPLAIAGFIRQGGIYENWFWWTAAFAGMFTVFFFARLWNRAGIITDVEFIEFRYTGRPATMLRLFNAFFRVFGQCICCGWVILAVGKIVSVCFNLPPTVTLGFGSVSLQVSSNVIIYAILLAVTLSYTMFAGLWGVVMTDVMHFFAAMTGFIVLAVIILVDNNGPAQMVKNITASGASQSVFNFLPDFKTAGSLAIFTFFVYVGLLWWYSAAGIGIITQRMLACKDGKHAGLAVIWGYFCIIIVRSWPWIVVGLASLIYFPVVKGEDAELAFPKMMVKFLPNGLIGVVFASFIAAFLSTIAANLNLAASYLMNDFYVRFIKPEAKGKGDYMVASRVATVIVLLLAVFVTWQMKSISSAWKYFAEIYAGAGFVMLLRWFWWRINAWSEISAMITSFVLANAFRFMPAFSPDEMFAVRYVIIVGISTVVWVVVTLATKPVNMEHLKVFYGRVLPGGWWGPLSKQQGVKKSSTAAACWLGWLISVVTIYLGLFGTIYLCIANYPKAIACFVLFGIGTYFSVQEIAKISVLNGDSGKTANGEEK